MATRLRCNYECDWLWWPIPLHYWWKIEVYNSKSPLYPVSHCWNWSHGMKKVRLETKTPRIFMPSSIAIRWSVQTDFGTTTCRMTFMVMTLPVVVHFYWGLISKYPLWYARDVLARIQSSKQDEFISVIARTQAGIDIAQLEAMLHAFWHGVDLLESPMTTPPAMREWHHQNLKDWRFQESEGFGQLWHFW